MLPSDISDELVTEIVDRGVVCAMLTNTITGAAWERHLEQQAERSESESEDTGREQRRARTSAELRQERRASGEGIETRRRNAQKLIERGCVVTIGTDNYLGSAPEFRRTPKRENQEAGIGSIIAIEGLGTLEVGKLADVLILDADPLQDISNIRRLNSVFKEGRLVDLDALPYERIFSKPDPT